MRDNKSSSEHELLAARCGNHHSDSMRNDGVVPSHAADPHRVQMTDENPPKPFKPRCIDLTPECEGLNVGYVGGVRVPMRKSNAEK